MQDINLRAITTDKINFPAFLSGGIEADMLRLDTIHPFISGNKWFKLRYYLEEALSLKKKRLITFGGAWSNHLLATAAACELYGLQCTGVIRGERPAVWPDILQQASAMGMQLVFLDRTSYAAQDLPDELRNEENYFVQQGGYGTLGAKGAASISAFVNSSANYTHILCATGTGTMLAGLAGTNTKNRDIIGISVLRNNFSLEEEVRQLITGKANTFTLLHDYHFGGYAKYTGELIRFMNDWFVSTGIPTDFVYTGKLCFAAAGLAQKNFFPEGSRILLIHSGGLSGNASLKKGTLIF